MARARNILFAAALLLAQSAFAFGGNTEPAADRGEPSLKWRSKVITIALSSSLQRPAPNVKPGSDVLGAVRRALAAWATAGNIEFREVFTDKQNVSPAGLAGDGVNLITLAPSAENALLFAKNADEVAATTRVFFDSRGRISEADIVLNPYQQFSTDGTFGSFDLEATVTHEIGHVLGLEHSSVRGSTMYENFGKNGVFGLQGYGPRTLSELDRAAIRSKYGSPDTTDACCGTVSGKVQLPDGRPAADVDVWLEDRSTGQVAGQTMTGADGAVEFAGLRAGTYSVYSARKERAKRALPQQSLAEITVAAGEAASFTRKLEPAPDDVEVKYTGFNGQLTVNSVPINAGKSYTVYIGGRNLNPRSISIHFDSPFLEVTPGSLVSHDYGADLSVLSFEVTADPSTPIGEYTVFVESAGGGRSAAVGGISVRAFPNPYSNFILDSKMR